MLFGGLGRLFALSLPGDVVGTALFADFPLKRRDSFTLVGSNARQR